MFSRAIVRTPGENFADGLTAAELGSPDFALALAQHQTYCRALESCGLELTVLPPELRYPDSTFVEDAAVLTGQSAILTRPGAVSRRGEVDTIRPAIQQFYRILREIQPLGTLDGGDICEAGSHFFIGISQRTNEEGAHQLQELLTADGFSSSVVDIRGVDSILHLKSGIAALADNQLVVMEELAERPEFKSYDVLRVPSTESYACNSVLVNDRVLVPEGSLVLQGELVRRGYQPLPLDMSEFRKMDGGLSCLSLRF